MAKRAAYVGIDVAFAKKKRLPICVCTVEHGKPTPLALRASFQEPPAGRGNKAALLKSHRTTFAEAVKAWLLRLQEDKDLTIQRIAIDAPRDYAQGQRRDCERAMDRRGISCFATPTRKDFAGKILAAKNHLAQGGKEARLPSANQLWMLVGFSLFRALENTFDCIEVFPQAIVRAIGCGGEHKSTQCGLADQIGQFAAATGQSESVVEASLSTIGFGSKHDRLDALLSAWVASLPAAQRAACGNPPNDAIWIPTVPGCTALKTTAPSV